MWSDDNDALQCKVSHSLLIAVFGGNAGEHQLLHGVSFSLCGPTSANVNTQTLTLLVFTFSASQETSVREMMLNMGSRV